MTAVLVLVPAVDGSAFALLTLARRLGSPLAVACGPADDVAVAALGRFGAASVYSVSSTDFDRSPVAARVEVLAALARRRSPAAVLIAASRTGQEVAARLSVRLDSGAVGDVVDLRADAGGPVAVQAAGGGSGRVESRVVRGTPVFAVRTAAVTPSPAPAEPAVTRTHFALPSRTRAARRLGPGQRPSLATADIVVAGGHGVGSRAGFDLVGQVADALGGAVGGSHTATEFGWCPRNAQVDQTGTIVHPRLYVALGISGSVRHRAAMRHATTVIAVDRDPASPIFEVADLGVVGDLHEVVPALLTEIKRRRSSVAPKPATTPRRHP